jgi:hypothetical protein
MDEDVSTSAELASPEPLGRSQMDETSTVSHE